MLLDIFKNDAFNVISLSEAMISAPFKPGRLGEMGLFMDSPISTTTASFEEKEGVLALIPATQRGGPGVPHATGKRHLRAIAVPHIQLDDRVTAGDLSGVRAFGSETELETVADVVNGRLVEMKNSHEVTLEYHRLGAIKGIVLDADGATEIADLYDLFGVTAPSIVYFDLEDSTTDVKAKCLEVKRAVEKALGIANIGNVHAFVGKDFFDLLTGHEETKAAYERWMNGQALREDMRTSFPFGGIMFEEYPGTVGGQQFIGDTEARFFPVGIPRLFKTIYAPADYVETVNTLGRPYYAKQWESDDGKAVNLETQQNPLCVCMRPRALIQGSTGAPVGS